MKTKTMCSCALVACLTTLGAFADEAPHWIGLDTTLRDQQTWVAPTETACSGSLDTQVYDVVKSVGETIRGAFRGLILLFR